MAHYIRKAHLYYDRRFDLFFADNLLCCNYSDIEDIQNRFRELKANPHDTISLMSHNIPIPITSTIFPIILTGLWHEKNGVMLHPRHKYCLLSAPSATSRPPPLTGKKKHQSQRSTSESIASAWNRYRFPPRCRVCLNSDLSTGTPDGSSMTASDLSGPSATMTSA